MKFVTHLSDFAVFYLMDVPNDNAKIQSKINEGYYKLLKY